MTFLVWVYTSQDFAHTLPNCAQSHDCMTATFRISAGKFLSCQQNKNSGMVKNVRILEGPDGDNCSLLDRQFWALWALLGTFVTLVTFFYFGHFSTPWIRHNALGHSPGIIKNIEVREQ